MSNAFAQRAANITKTWVLFLGFAAFLIAIGWFLSETYGNPTILLFAVVFSFGTTAVSYWFSDKLALRASRAKEVDRAQAPELWGMVERLANAASMPMPRVYMTDDMQINAFATGRNPKHAAIAVTKGMMQKLSPQEVEGVLAHELSHVKNRDILVSSVAVVLAGVLAMASQYLSTSFLFGGRDREGGGASSILGFAVLFLAPIGATIMQLAISRKRESLADLSGSLITGRPGDLADALTKIAQDGAKMPRANNATAHLWISSPFKGKEGLGFIKKLFMTHPPLEERIAKLRSLQEGG